MPSRAPLCAHLGHFSLRRLNPMTNFYPPADPTKAAFRDGDGRWLKRFSGLRSFVETHGRHPNTMFAGSEERSLASWCATQRLAYHGLGTARLSEDQILLLEALPDWSW